MENDGNEELIVADDQKIESLEDLRKLASPEDYPDEGETKDKVENETVNEDDVVVDEPPAYVPNFTYTVKDEQREFDERIRSVIKSKEDEDFVRDLYTKADGLDSVKEKLNLRNSEYGALYDHTKQLTSGYQRLLDLKKSKNFEDLQEALGLDDDFIVEWGLSKVEQDELPPEQKNLLAENKKLQKELSSYQNQLSQFETEAVDRRVESDINELQTLVRSPEVLPVAIAMQEKGHSFVDTVVAIGNLEYQKTGKEPTVREVVQRVAEQYKWLVPKQETEQQQQPVQQVIKQPVQQKPTLPTIDGIINQATVDKPISSMEELKRLAEQIG